MSDDTKRRRSERNLEKKKKQKENFDMGYTRTHDATDHTICKYCLHQLIRPCVPYCDNLKPLTNWKLFIKKYGESNSSQYPTYNKKYAEHLLSQLPLPIKKGVNPVKSRLDEETDEEETDEEEEDEEAIGGEQDEDMDEEEEDEEASGSEQDEDMENASDGSLELSFLYHRTQAEMSQTWGGPGFTFPEEKKIKKTKLIGYTADKGIELTPIHMVLVPNKEQVAYTLHEKKQFTVVSLNNLKDKRQYNFKKTDKWFGEKKIYFFPAGNKALIYFARGAIVYDMKTEQTSQRVDFSEPSFRNPDMVAFSADGNWMANVTDKNAKITVWSTKNFKVYKQIEIEVTHRNYDFQIRKFAFLSADATELVFVENFREEDDQKKENTFSRICIWDTTKKENAIRTVHTSAIDKKARSMAISRNRDKLAVGFHDGSLFIFNISNSSTWIPFKTNSSFHANQRVTALCFSPDGNYVVSGGGDNKIFYWDFNRNLIGMIGIINQEATILAISNDQTKILSYDYDNSIYMWTIDKTIASD